tara:strand:+ start:467 stop:679 length:213 start_codon:yes stop_codon:yes gene_type:complete
MTNLEAVKIIDDYSSGSDSTIIGMLETTEAEYISAFQHLIDDGIVWLMKQPFPQNAKHLIQLNYCTLRCM